MYDWIRLCLIYPQAKAYPMCSVHECIYALSQGGKVGSGSGTLKAHACCTLYTVHYRVGTGRTLCSPALQLQRSYMSGDKMIFISSQDRATNGIQQEQAEIKVKAKGKAKGKETTVTCCIFIYIRYDIHVHVD